MFILDSRAKSLLLLFQCYLAEALTYQPTSAKYASASNLGFGMCHLIDYSYMMFSNLHISLHKVILQVVE